MKFFKLAIIIVAFLGAIYIIYNNNKESNCYRHKEFLPIKFNGRIIDKYLDSAEHLYPTIIIKQIDAKEFIHINLIHEKSDLFNYLQIGDTISKRKDQNIITIIRQADTIIRNIDFGCIDKTQ
jgi:hypothetical protein